MNLKNILYCFIFFVAINTKAQDLTVDIKSQAQEMVDALLSGDYKTVVSYTYPNLIKRVGGNDKILDLISSSMEELKSKGRSIEKVTLGNPGKIFNSGSELYSIIPEQFIMNFEGSRFTMTSALLAISNDQGKHWSFLDCNMGKETLNSLVLNLNQQMEIPKSGELIKL